jgi:hypothetical protein
LADVTGIVTLSFPAISSVGTADIVVTKQFKQPYIGSVQIISPTGPYVIYTSNTIDDSAGNNNSLVDYNELISMDVDVQNIGSVNANSVTLTISTLDPVVTLINTTDVINVINASQTLSINNPFTFQVANFITDQHIVVFTLDMVDNLGNSWSSTINVTLNAPVLDHTTFTYRYTSNQPSSRHTSLCPNYIHSLDAWVARMMIRMAEAQGFQLAHIHDSFWASPNHMNNVRDNYRVILAKLADSDALSTFIKDVTGDNIVLIKDSANLSKHILNSEYALS